MAILQSSQISGSLSISGSITAQSIIGDGSSLTGVVAVAPAGTVSGSAQVVSLLGSHSGNVGIGTTSPSSFANYKNLSIKGGSSGANLDFHNSSGTRVAAIVSNPSTNFIVETNEATPIVLKTNDTERMRITSDGNVGIGVTTTNNPLYVQKDAGGHAVAYFNSLNADGYGVLIRTADNGNDKYILRLDSNSGSTPVMYVTNAGNVGVGTTSPAPFLSNANAAVDVGNSNGGEFVARRSGGQANLAMGVTGGDIGYLYSTTNTPMVFGVNNAERVRIDTSGRLFLGTATIATANTAADDFVIKGEGTAVGMTISNSSDAGTGTIFFGDSTSSAAAGFRYNHNTGDMAISAEDNITITADAVSIGTTSPVKNFEVEVNNSNTTVTSGNGLVGGAAGSGILIRNSNTTAGVYANLDFRANNADGRIAYKYTGTTNVGDFHFITDNLSVPISAMVIKNDGKVGIGATSPSAKLEVSSADTVKTAIHIDNTSTGGNRWDIASLGSGVAGRVGNLQIRNDSDSANYVEITAVGNVGIGTTSPSEKLHVVGAIKTSRTSGASENTFIYNQQSAKWGSSTFPGIIESVGNNSFLIGSSQNIPLHLARSGAIALTVGTGNNIGIGTTSPAAKLEITGGDSLNALKITDSGNGDGFKVTSHTTQGTYIQAYDASHVQTIMLDARTDNGTRHTYFNGGGNVGIGTTSPSQKLHVQGANTLLRLSSTSNYVDMIMVNASNTGFLNLDGSNMNFFVGGGSGGDLKMSIGTNGNVGIGTASPSKSLHIQTNDSAYGSMRIYRDSTTQGEVSIGFFGKSNSATNEAWVIGEGGWSNANDFVIGNENSGAGGNVRLLIQRDGNVGIGTTSPDSKLHVSSGDIRITNNSPSIYFYDSDVSGLYHRILGGGNKGLEYSVDPNNVTAGYHRWDIGGTVVAQLIEGGNFGLGTTTPKTQLHLNGGGSYNNTDANNRFFIERDNHAYILYSVPDGKDSGIHFHNTTDNAFVGRIAYSHNASGDSMRFRVGSASSTNEYLIINSSGLVEMSGDLTVGGIVTAQEFHTEFVSASIVYQSGSTKFGDTSDDVHEFTGSVDVLGSMSLTKAGSTHNLNLYSGDDFADSSGDTQIWITSGIGTFKSGEGAHLVFEGRRSTRNFYFKVGDVASPQHIMHHGGNVGIGTGDATPSNTLQVNGGIDANTLNTGQGDNELYAMDQNVRTTDSPTFDELTLTGPLRIDNGGTSVDAIVLKGTAPTISFLDDDSGADDFYIHINSNNFYVLANRDGDNIEGTGWETPHPLQLEADTNIGYLFDQRIFNEAYHPNADKWTTARTITLGGDLSGNVSIDGSANVTLSATVANDSHTHDGRYYTETESDARFLGISAKAADSDLLDGLNSSQFLRSDASDSTSGNLDVINTGAQIAVAQFRSSDNYAYINIGGATNSDSGIIFTEGGSADTATNRRYMIGYDASEDHLRFYQYYQGDGTTAVNANRMWLDAYGNLTVAKDLFVDDYARIDALRVGTTSTDPGDGNLYVEGTITVDGAAEFNASAKFDGDINNSQGTGPAVYIGLSDGLDPQIQLQGSGGSDRPHIDFSNSVSEDFDARIILDGDNVLTVDGAELYVDTSRVFHDTYHPNADKWTTARTITLGGDLSGNVSIDGSANATLTATIAANSVALGTDTTGNYVGTITAGTGINTTGATSGEGIAHTISVDVSDFMTNGANNRVITATGTDGMTAESNLTFDGTTLTTGGNQNRIKLGVWNSTSTYGIGMQDSYTYGHLNNDYAMTFEMNNDSDRGFWFGDDSHSNAQGAFSMTTQGKGTIATSLSIGEGESVTSPSSTPLYVEGSGSVIFDVQGSLGQLFSVTDDLTGTLFSVNDISGIPILTVDSDDTVTMGTFGANTLVVTGSRVGIGTAEPALRAGLSSYTPFLHINSNTAGVNPTLHISADNVDEASLVLSEETATYGYGARLYYQGSGNNFFNIEIVDNNTATDRLTIDRYGRVGLSTVNPTSDGYTYAQDLVIKGGASTSDGAGITINSNGKRYGIIAFGDAADTNAGEIFYDHTSNVMNFRANGSANVMTLDGSGNVTIPGTFTGNGSGLTSLNASNISSGTISDARLPGSITSDITGNAATATKWATARTITLGGDLSGNVSIDGSANVTLTATVANDSHTHDGRYYTESESDSRFVNVTGDTITGDLAISNAQPKLKLFETDTTNQNKEVLVSGGALYIRNLNDNDSAGSNLFVIENDGDVEIKGTNLYFDGTNTYLRSDNEFRFLTDGGSAQFGRFKSIQVSTSYSGTPPDNGILFGTDTNLFRSAANTLRTNDSLIVDGDVGIGTTSPGGKLDVAGNIEATDQISVNNRTAISVAHWGNGSSSSTGAVKIQIPGSHGSNWSMLVLRITTYEYNSTAGTVYYVSGHDWTSGWYNNGVIKIGTSNKDVSLGYDSNYDYVIVGDTSSTWSYGHVTVDVMAHPSFYSGAMDITTGWSISQVTSLSGITVQSVTNKRVLTTSDEGSGNGIDADTVDGIQAASFLRSDASDSTSGDLTVGGDLFVNDYARIDALRVGTTSTDPGDGNLVVEGDVTIGGGDLNFTNGTRNRISFNTSGVAAPTFNSTSNGAKIVLYPEVGASSVDYSIGIEGNTMWFAVPQAGAARFFKWYGGTTNIATLASDGELTLSSVLNATAVNTGQGDNELYAMNQNVRTSDDVAFDDITVGTTGKGADSVVRVLAGDSNKAGFEAYGNSQGTGYLYVGQSSTYGGGISYNGDGSPGFIGGETADRITFFNRNAGTNTEVFSYAYSNTQVDFNGTITAANIDTGQGATEVYLMNQNVRTTDSPTFVQTTFAAARPQIFFDETDSQSTGGYFLLQAGSFYWGITNSPSVTNDVANLNLSNGIFTTEGSIRSYQSNTNITGLDVRDSNSDGILLGVNSGGDAYFAPKENGTTQFTQEFKWDTSAGEWVFEEDVQFEKIIKIQPAGYYVLANADTTRNSHKWQINGTTYWDLYINANGNLEWRDSNGTQTFDVQAPLSKSSGTFKIKHPDPSKNKTHYLHHSFVESPTAGDNIYRWQVEVVDGTAVVELPDYYKYLNENDQVWVSPFKHFGQAYGEVNEEQTHLTITANADGLYNVLCIGTRKDEDAVNAWTGCERLQPEPEGDLLDRDEYKDYKTKE